jgi:hypothetical protein
MPDEPTAAAADASAEDSDKPTTATDDQPAVDYRDFADALRARVDLFGKTLAAIATLGTTAVGLAKIGDLFPADGNGGWAFLAAASLVAAALGAIFVAVRLMRVSRPVFTSVDSDRDQPEDEAEPELDADERKAIKPVYSAAAKQFGYSSLEGLRERERSLRSAAGWTADADERTRRLGLADEVKAVIDRALAQAQVVVVRLRATQAVSGWAWLGYVAEIACLILFAVGTDRVKSDRTDRVAEAKACGEAREAGATATELGRAEGVCDAAAAETPPEEPIPSAAEARAAITSQLAAVLEECTALVHEGADPESGPLEDDDCDPVREAVGEIDPASP